MNRSVYHALTEAARSGEKVALGILTAVKGSSPQKIGAKALFYPDGRICGTLGGGCLEAEVQQRALQSLATTRPSSFELLLDHDFGWDDGLICGGKVGGLILPNAQTAGEKFWEELAERKTNIRWGVKDDFTFFQSGPGDLPPESLYHEGVSPPCDLWIAGAGHLAQAVAPLALRLDFAVTIFDDRPALANHQFFPTATRILTDEWNRLLATPFPLTPAFGLIVTRGHRHDALVLREWIQKPFAFLGMIGSARKARIIFAHFLEAGIATPEQIERVKCPVGVDIRSQTVEEIAVSIVAQLIEKRAVTAGR